MLDVIKKEAEYKQHLSFRKSEKFVDYFAVMRDVVEDSNTTKEPEAIVTNTKIEDSKNTEILEKSKKEDIKQEEVKQEEVKTEELKKEEVKKVNRKYSEEVIRKSLGLGVKLKSKTK